MAYQFSTNKTRKVMKTIEEERTFKHKFPFVCTNRKGIRFVPTVIDYDNEAVKHQKSQASENCDWYQFDEVEFEVNPDFCLPDRSSIRHFIDAALKQYKDSEDNMEQAGYKQSAEYWRGAQKAIRHLKEFIGM